MMHMISTKSTIRARS